MIWIYIRDTQIKDRDRVQKFSCICTDLGSLSYNVGSSIAVTSFRAGREFATKTTCKNNFITHFDYIHSLRVGGRN
jgi:hypothetical protein